MDIPHSKHIELRRRGASAFLFTGTKAMGLRVSPDDFGTGYSLRSTLKRFPVDYMMIDRSSFREVTATDGAGRSRTRSTRRGVVVRSWLPARSGHEAC